MKEKDVDTYLRQHLSGDQPREAFRQQTLKDSSAEFVRIQRRRSAWRRAERAAAAVLIAGVAFLGGRLSAPPALPRNVDITPQAAAEPDGITVSGDLVAWLDAARLFGQLRMQDRMAEAVEYAGRLLPAYPVDASGVVGQNVLPTGEDIFENQNQRSILDEILRPHESVETVSGIMAHSFGGYYYESEME